MSTSPDAPIGWLVLAHLLRPQGRKGELLADLLTDFPERFDDQQRIFLAKPGFAASAEEARTMHVVGHWLPVGRNHGRIVLSLEGIDTITKAEELAGLDLIIPASERMVLEDDDAEYIDELIGCSVFDSSRPIGTVRAIDFPTTADGVRRLPDAAPLLTVTNGDGVDILIPYVQSFLVRVATAEKRIDMVLPSGLVELNQVGPFVGEPREGEQGPSDPDRRRPEWPSQAPEE